MSDRKGKPKRTDYDRVSSWRGVQREQGGRGILVNLSPNERKALEVLAPKGQRTAVIGRLILAELRRQVAAGELPASVLEQLDKRPDRAPPQPPSSETPSPRDE